MASSVASFVGESRATIGSVRRLFWFVRASLSQDEDFKDDARDRDKTRYLAYRATCGTYSYRKRNGSQTIYVFLERFRDNERRYSGVLLANERCYGLESVDARLLRRTRTSSSLLLLQDLGRVVIKDGCLCAYLVDDVSSYLGDFVAYGYFCVGWVCVATLDDYGVWDDVVVCEGFFLATFFKDARYGRGEGILWGFLGLFDNFWCFLDDGSVVGPICAPLGCVGEGDNSLFNFFRGIYFYFSGSQGTSFESTFASRDIFRLGYIRFLVLVFLVVLEVAKMSIVVKSIGGLFRVFSER